MTVTLDGSYRCDSAEWPADAARNRASLIEAARLVFERDGFLRARVTDISAAAGVAHGSFYSHFDSKESVLVAVLEQVETEMLHPGSALSTRDTDRGRDRGGDPRVP